MIVIDDRDCTDDIRKYDKNIDLISQQLDCSLREIEFTTYGSQHILLCTR